MQPNWILSGDLDEMLLWMHSNSDYLINMLGYISLLLARMLKLPTQYYYNGLGNLGNAGSNKET